MPLKTHQDEMPQLNLTPMIDVVFLLIVFFMTASNFSDPQRDIDLKVPEVAKADAADATRRTRRVAVYSGGRLTLDDADVTLAELTTQLRTAHDAEPQLGVVILGDATCEFQHVAEALAACKEAGVGELAVSVRIAQAASSERR
jgi:biopolymer transport protein ExbD